MEKTIAQILLMGKMVEGMGSPNGSMRDRPDPSTTTNIEVCPNCGEEHRSNKHLYCSKECAKEAGKI